MKSKKAPSPIDDTAEFERLLRETRDDERYKLRLYVTGNSPRSAQAISNVHALCEEYLPGRYDLEVIDIYQQPTEANAQQIIAAPTLIKSEPSPPKRLIGDLSNRDRVIVGLDLHPDGSDDTKWAKI